MCNGSEESSLSIIIDNKIITFCNRFKKLYLCI